MITQPILWILAVFLGVAVFEFARQEFLKPVTWGKAISTSIQDMQRTLMLGGAIIAGIFVLFSHLLGGMDTRLVDGAEFGTGMTQALERVAYLRGAEAEGFREWSGRSMDGSRYAILRDDAGAMVRAENLSRVACLSALNFLSPYAASVLTIRDERGVVPVDTKAPVCPVGEARLQAVFRARG